MKNEIFRQRIRSALADSTLQSALDGNAERRLDARQQAYASLSQDFSILRQRAHQVREHTIQDLDRYLEQFSQQALANGIQVHRAQTAAQAVEMILEIANQSGAKLIGKSKTMVGEEIHLNQALEKQGFQVVETDLGEYIVQLRGEPPAHIITPAVHLTRQQVGHTFQEKLDLPYSEDISFLTAAARQVLRQTFLDADIGISGVNFGVAETGTLCLLTNEGNGRMATTLPKIHIALMGMERLVPSLPDLALMLELLPRSATGQKITVYTSLIQGPRRPGEIDGPQQRHLVLLDNGRSALRQSALSEMLYCIRCGACLNACPVFREIGGHAYVSQDGDPTPYPGPMGSVLSPGLFGVPEFGALARASSLCGACQEACPVDIPLPKLLLRVRAAGAEPDSGLAPQEEKDARKVPIPGALKFGLQFYTWLASSPLRFQAAQRLAGLGARLISPHSEWLRMPAFTGWGASRDLPRPAVKPFRARFKAYVQPAQVLDQAGEHCQQAQDTFHHHKPGNLPTSTQPDATAAIPAQETQGLLERFSAEIQSLGGQLIQCNAQQAPGQILKLLKDLQIQRIQTWSAESLPHNLRSSLEQGGIHCQVEPDPELKAGVTGALGAAADTGTLALASAPGQPLTASLLPEIHIACLHASQILPTLTDLITQPWIAQAANTVLISGPSRTADIEMTLTIGVHGPKQLIVVCIEENLMRAQSLLPPGRRPG